MSVVLLLSMLTFADILLDRQTDRRATVVSVGTLDHPTEQFLTGVFGPPASSGASVSPQTADGLPAVYACNSVIKQDVAKTPIKLKKKNADGTRQDDPDHPVYVALHDMPNRVMTPYEFKEQMQDSLNLWGNAYAEVIRHRTSAHGLKLELWPLEPWRMTVEVDSKTRLKYSYAMPSGPPKEWFYDPDNPPIFHIRQDSRGGFVGRSRIQVVRELMGVAWAEQAYQGRFYGQGGHPRLGLSTSQKLTSDAARRIRTDFEAMTVGEQNWHRVIVMDHDLKPVPLVMPHKDAEFVEQLKLTRSQIAGMFRVYAQKINDLEKATFSNITELNIAHVGDTLMPHFVSWQDAIARDLLTIRSFNTHYAVFKVDALMRGDPVKFNESLQLQRQNGVISANEWRRYSDMDDMIPADQGGDDLLVNGNMTPIRREPSAPKVKQVVRDANGLIAQIVDGPTHEGG